MAYLLDANVFISAKNLHYGFDFCPAFWDWLKMQNQAGVVYNIERVGNELLAGDDELVNWTSEQGSSFFVPPDLTIFPALSEVSSWVIGQEFDQAAVSSFFQIADYYLVVQALAGQHTIVTHEIPSGSKRKIKIPNVCIGLGTRSVTPFEMLRKERARFVLGS